MKGQYERLVGKILDKHKIEEHLGSGGFSHVYRVRNIIDDSIKLFKILDEEVFGKVWQRSIHEGRVLEDLADIEGVPDFYHCKVFSQHSISSHYLALEYIPGRNLQDIINSGDSKKMSERVKTKILYDLVVIIDQMHQNGIIHRDINPSNIIVSKNKQIHLIDFFLANYLDKSKNPPRVYQNKFFGTIGFFAPESQLTAEDQIKFEKEENEATDIYGFGTTAYALMKDIARETDVETQTRILHSLHELGGRPYNLASPERSNSAFGNLLIDATMSNQDRRPSSSSLSSEFKKLAKKRHIFKRFLGMVKKIKPGR